MKLMAPANYDHLILDELKKNSVSEIYGRLSSDVVGGGRPDYMAGPQNRRRLLSYVQAINKSGMEFNYLLNSACLGNREWTRTFQKKVRQLLDWIVEIGIKKVTVSTAYLAQIIAKEYPQLAMKIGIYAQVDSVKRAKYWEELGAKDIVLESFSINRNFDLLQKIRASVECELTLIANHFCQPNCPYQIQHQNGHAHASGGKTSFYLDFPIIQCQLTRLQNPSLLIASQWIRPEDIGAYEAIGYHSFKLIERNIPSSALLERARAYHSKKFQGNFADLIFSWGFKEKDKQFSKVHFAKKFKLWKLKPRTLMTVAKFMKSQGMFFEKADGHSNIRIHTHLLGPDFIQSFKNRDCSNLDCKECGFCEKVAQRVIETDKPAISNVVQDYKAVEALLLKGEF